MLRTRSAAFVSGNTEDYKRARYDLRRAIKGAKRQYTQKLEGYYINTDSRRMWQGLQHITDYQQRNIDITTSNPSLTEELNEFYARFEALTIEPLKEVPATESTQDASLIVSVMEVRRALLRNGIFPAMLRFCAVLVCALALISRNQALADEELKGERFVCTAVPAGTDLSCPVEADNRVQSASPQEDEFRSTIVQLRETVLQQKETIASQQGTIKELNSKLVRCETSESKWRGGARRKEQGKNTMGDLPRDPTETVEQLGKTMQGLKDRLENLEQQLHTNVSGSPFPSELRDLLKRRLGTLESQLLRRVAELEEEKSQLYNETLAHRQHTENTLKSLLERITELERSNSAFKSPEDFKVSLPLRTNYLYGRFKKSLPEMYAFTVCMWLKSSASPGIGTPFSYGVPGQANEIVLIEWGTNPIELLVNDKVAQLPLSVGDGRWHHICITWTTRDGFWEAYQDGERLGTGENLAPWHPIKPGGVIILGQEQDIVGGRFDATQAFVGELSHFNMWDRVLRPIDISNMANCSAYMPGNVVPWIDTNVEVFGGATKAALEICEDRLFDS
ncbi:neuronal pentraxin-2a [Trichomycterus rosablanca]|uniref:neuronal pentraxin-2a n=1 Tax=Trichomycterus rosablanca TaxID=2290929 RepID=UPI002F353F3F